MRRGIVKLLLSLVATAAAATSLVASTFAYVLINNKVIIPDFDFNIEGQEGLQISLDNKTWSQDILASQLKQTMSDKFDDLKFSCVTIRQDQNGKIELDDNNEIKFYYDEVDGTLDQTTGKTVYTHLKTNTSKNEDNGFIKFDLYLKSKSSYETKKDFTLKMTENTNIKSNKLDTITVSNKLETMDKKYNPGDEIQVDVANAIRMGIYNVDQDENNNFTKYNNFNIYEMTNEYDLGSVALESHRGLKDKYDPEVNAMYTYYNNYFVKYPLVSGAEDGDAFITKDRDGLLADSFGTFNFDENKNDYNTIKLEVYIWLEGWDADYLLGLSEGTKIEVDLEFKIV